ncbi:MAG: protein kinase domain-containing protein [Limisphaerales bacterium]
MPAPFESKVVEAVEALGQKHRTGVFALVFTDMVGSTALKQKLGDRASASLFGRHHQMVRETLAGFPEGEEIETAGDSFLLVFSTPSEAVRFGLLLQARLRKLRQEVQADVADRLGIHLGEVVLGADARSRKPRDVYGIQIDTCSRVMSLAKAGQILMTRAVFDSARQVLKGEDIEGLGPMEWLNHGPYLLKGLEETVEVCEVREAGQGTGEPPASSEKAQRQARADEEHVLGWRPAVGQLVPNTKWVLEQKLGEGGFGEVWLGCQRTTKEHRVFKFCFQAERVRFLKRELTLFRLLKERVGDHPNIVRLHDIYLDQAPFYVEMDYVEGRDLKAWCEVQGGVNQVSLETRLEIVAQVADALQAAHDAGVIHRDVKPGNILVSGEWRVASGGQASGTGASPDSSLVTRHPSLSIKLTDFGIGQVVSEEYLSGITRAGFTQTIMSDSSSSHTGTQVYMAPELLAGKPASTRSDIYSLGVVLYQFLVGDFSRPVTTDWAKHVPDSLLREDLVRCFAGDPTERFGSAAELAKNLRAQPERRAALQRQETELAAREKAAYRRGVTRTAALCSLAVLLFATLAWYAIQQARRAGRAASDAVREQHRAGQSELLARKSLYDADMNLAFQALAANRLGRTIDLLDQYRPKPGQEDLRRWEWRYLWQASRGDEIATLQGQDSIVTATAYSPNESVFASASWDGTIRIWSTINNQVLATLNPRFPIGTLAFSSRGEVLAAGGRGKVVVWRMKDLAMVDTFDAQTEVRWDSRRVVCFGAGDDLLLVGQLNGEILFRDYRAHTNRFVFKERESIFALQFSPDHRLLATAALRNQVHVWETKGGTNLVGPKYQFQLGDERAHYPIFDLQFSPSSQLLAASTFSEAMNRGLIRIWNLADGRVVADLTNHTRWVGDLAFFPDGSRLASSSADESIRIWDSSDWKEKVLLKGHLNEVWSLAISPDGARIATGGKDNLIKLWDPQASARSHGLRFITNFDEVVFSADAGSFVGLSRDRPAEVWSTDRLVKVQDLPSALQSAADRMALAGGLVATLSTNGVVTVGNFKSGKVLRTIQGESPVLPLLLAPKADRLAFATQDPKTIRVFKLPGGEKLTPFHWTQPQQPLGFSPDGQWLLAGMNAGKGVLWDLARNQGIEFQLDNTREWDWACFSPDSRCLAAGSPLGVVSLWEIGSAGLGGHRSINADLMALISGSFSPDSKRLVVTSGAGILWLWDTQTEQEVCTLPSSSHSLGTRVCFSADGSHLLLFEPESRRLSAYDAPPLATIEAELKR